MASAEAWKAEYSFSINSSYMCVGRKYSQKVSNPGLLFENLWSEIRNMSRGGRLGCSTLPSQKKYHNVTKLLTQFSGHQRPSLREVVSSGGGVKCYSTSI